MEYIEEHNYTIKEHLDRIESKLDKLLEKKKPVKPRGVVRTNYPNAFRLIWDSYPGVAGANKAKAYAAYKKRLGEVNQPEELASHIHDAVIAYAAYCEATDRFVMLPATFLGPAEHYLCDWTIPATKVTVPKDDQEAIKWGQERGIEPKLGEPMYEYRRRLEGAL